MNQDELYCQQLFVLDRDYYSRRAQVDSNVQELDLAHQQRITEMLSCIDYDALYTLTQTPWI